MIRTSIRRPVAIAMAYGAIALLGVAAWRNIPIELLPDTQLPRLTVSASWPGASPEVTEAFLTAPLEAAVQQIEGVARVSSVSSERFGSGQADIEVEFARETDMDFARLELSERIAALDDELPAAAGRPVVTPYIPEEFQEQQQPFLRYTITGPYTLEALRAHLDDRIAPDLRQVEGVAQVGAYGGRERLLQVELVPEKIDALGLSLDLVRQRLLELELIREAGQVRSGGTLHTLALRERAETIGDIRSVPLLSDRGRVVRLSDVGVVHDTHEEAQRHYRIEGQPAVSFTIYKEIGSNTVAVADRVKQRLSEIDGAHPAGVRLILDDDESEAIRAQLTDLRSRAIIAGVVIFVVLLLFLRSLPSAAIVFTTIAFSILITINLIYWGGYSLNVLTLMGLAMGFGLIVDNAIVVLENVYRHSRAGEPAEVAAERGAKEVVLPVLAATVTTLVVMVPFVYLQGELRVFYVPLALVVGFSLISALFVAFTFIPALAARVLRGPAERRSEGPADLPPLGGAAAPVAPAVLGERLRRVVNGALAAVRRATGFFRRIFGSLSAGGRRPSPPGPLSQNPSAAPDPPGRGGDENGLSASRPLGLSHSGSGPTSEPIYVRFYRGLTGWTLRWPWTTVIIALIMLGGSYYLFDKYVNRGIVWGGWGGQDTYIRVTIELPRGEELERTDELVRYFEARVQRMPEVESFTANVYPQYAWMEITFPDSLLMTAIPVYIKEQMVAFSHQFGGAEVRVQGFGPSFYGGGSSPPNYSIQILGYNYETARDIAEGLANRLTRFSRIQDVDTNATGRWFDRDKATELVLKLDRDRLGLHGLTARDVVARVRTAVAGADGRSSNLRLGGEELRFAIKLEGYDRMDLLELEELLIPAAGGQGVRLGEVATLTEREVLSRIVRQDQQYQRNVAYQFRGPVKLGDRVRDAVIDATELPPGYTIVAQDTWRWSSDEQKQIYGVLLVSLLLVFMVTAALFESVRQPLVVLLTVPMALIGVFLIFFYSGASFTREAYIGVIMMGGIVVNNAILLVDHVNGLRRRGGWRLHDAVLQGTLERVRPILMTSATTIFGLLPLVLFSEYADANIWNALGYALIGGLASSTLLVLTVTPALYLLFERRAARRLGEL